MLPISSSDPTASREPSDLPLTIPSDLWESIPEEQRATYWNAQRVIELLDPDEPVNLRDIASEAELSVEDALFALQTLDGMNLVSIGTTGRDVLVSLVAVPDEHVRVTGPDGRPRWVFVARPVTPPEVDPKDLN